MDLEYVLIIFEYIKDNNFKGVMVIFLFLLGGWQFGWNEVVVLVVVGNYVCGDGCEMICDMLWYVMNCL